MYEIPVVAASCGIGIGIGQRAEGRGQRRETGERETGDRRKRVKGKEQWAEGKGSFQIGDGQAN